MHMYTCIYLYICLYKHTYVYYDNWLRIFWRLGSPTICHLQVGEPVKLVVEFGLSLKSGELGGGN